MKHTHSDCKLSFYLLCTREWPEVFKGAPQKSNHRAAELTIGKAPTFFIHLIWFDSGSFFYIYFLIVVLPCLVVETLVTGSNFPPVRLRSATVVRPVMDNSQQTGRKNGPYQKHKNTQKRIKSLLLLKPVSSLPDMCCVCGCITFQAADPFVCNSCCCCCCRQSPCFSIYLGVVIIPKTFCVFLCLTLGEPLCLFFIF